VAGHARGFVKQRPPAKVLFGIVADPFQHGFDADMTHQFHHVIDECKRHEGQVRGDGHCEFLISSVGGSISLRSLCGNARLG